jgi:hypothetical protein
LRRFTSGWHDLHTRRKKSFRFRTFLLLRVNFALLSRSTNAEFGAKTPDEVLRSLTPDQRKRAGVQFFGEAAGDRLRHERYEEFCECRAARLCEALNEFLGID